MGFSNGFGTIAGMLCPIVTEKLTKKRVCAILSEQDVTENHFLFMSTPFITWWQIWHKMSPVMRKYVFGVRYAVILKPSSSCSRCGCAGLCVPFFHILHKQDFSWLGPIGTSQCVRIINQNQHSFSFLTSICFIFSIIWRSICPLLAKFTEFFLYAPNFEEVEEAYWFGPVRPSMRACVRAWVTLCMQSKRVRSRILKFDMWNKYEKMRRPVFFSFSVGRFVAELCPFFDFFFFFFFFFFTFS